MDNSTKLVCILVIIFGCLFVSQLLSIKPNSVLEKSVKNKCSTCKFIDLGKSKYIAVDTLNKDIYTVKFRNTSSEISEFKKIN